MTHFLLNFMIAIRIQGTIPESLGMLLYLTNINLDNNKLTVSGHSMSKPCIDLYPVWISLFFSRVHFRVPCFRLLEP